MKNKSMILWPILVLVLFYLQISGYRKRDIPHKAYHLFEDYVNIYPNGHGVDRTSASCITCKHVQYMRKRHWPTPKLICENCKSLHTHNMGTHYCYLEQRFACVKCKHVGLVSEEHQELEINCESCGHE